MVNSDPVECTERYIDTLFGPGMGKRHLQFLDRISNPTLREQVMRFHSMEANTSLLSIEENYLLAVCVLSALGRYSTAAMFAKVLRHLGTPADRILEAVGRLSMWVGGLPAVEASFAIQKALSEYERDPVAALAVWFPTETQP